MTKQKYPVVIGQLLLQKNKQTVIALHSVVISYRQYTESYRHNQTFDCAYKTLHTVYCLLLIFSVHCS